MFYVLFDLRHASIDIYCVTPAETEELGFDDPRLVALYTTSNFKGFISTVYKIREWWLKHIVNFKFTGWVCKFKLLQHYK